VVSSPRISIGPAGSRINRDHARRGWATKTSHRLFSVWHSRVHYSATRTSFATIFDVSENPIHRLSYAVPFVSIVIVVVEKSGDKVQSP